MRATDLVNAIGGGDSIIIFDAAESLNVSIDDLDLLFDTYSNDLTSKTDSAREQLSNFDTLLAISESANIIASMRLMQSILISHGIQLNPNDNEFNSMSIAMLDSAMFDLEYSWQIVDSVQQLLTGISAVPTLIIIPEQDFFDVSEDSLFIVNYDVTNIGDFTATGVFAKAFHVEGITIQSVDSISLADIAPGDTISISYSISLDSIINPTTSYQTSFFDVATYASNGSGSQASVLITTKTYICGDADNDGTGPNVADLVYLVNYLFKGGNAPIILTSGDVNANGSILVDDLVFLVDYLFRGGQPPICH